MLHVSDHVASSNTAFFVAFDKSGYVKSSHTKFQTTSDKSDDLSFNSYMKVNSKSSLTNLISYIAPYSTFKTACCSGHI